MAGIAARQHGVIGRRQLIGIGLTDREIAGRVARGALHRIHTGVYAVGHPRLTREGRWMAAVVACGQGSLLSFFDGAALLDFYEGTGPCIHVTVNSHRRVQGLILHRTRRIDPDEVTTKNGIPVTTVARTLVDLSGRLSQDRLLRAMREAEFKRLLDLTALNAAVERAHGRRGLTKLKQALAQHHPGQTIRSELEHRFAGLIERGGLRAPETNAPIKTARGSYILDCYWSEQRLAVELDGRDAHARELAFESDRRRDAALNAIGIRTLRFTWQRITYEPDEVLADLTAAMNRSSLSWSRS